VTPVLFWHKPVCVRFRSERICQQ